MKELKHEQLGGTVKVSQEQLDWNRSLHVELRERGFICHPERKGPVNSFTFKNGLMIVYDLGGWSYEHNGELVLDIAIFLWEIRSRSKAAA